MKKLLIFFLIISLHSFAQTDSENKQAIMSVLEKQQTAWSANDIEAFMQGYWQSDSLAFYGRNGVTNGWQKTLDNYKKSYPTADDTGELNFKIDAITAIEDNSYYLMGRYFLTRKAGDATGNFIIIFKKIDGKWKIIADMST